MKKTFFTLIVCVMVTSAAFAQFEETVLQPTHVVGRRINGNGEITMSLPSEFIYSGNGKLSGFEIPEYWLTTNYTYSGNYLMQKHTSHQGGYPYNNEITNYTYENGQIKTVDYAQDLMATSLSMLYTYYNDGRLARKDQKEGSEDYHMHWLYDYEDEGKTVIENYWTSWVTQGMLLREKNIYLYDDNYNLLSLLTESYSEAGELTNSTRTTFSYTQEGNKESEITQTLTEDEWVNNSIVQYAYDEQGRIIEQLNGIWDNENNEWNYKKRITFETSEGGNTYTVSFYKKSGDQWVWDVFECQTILFGPDLKNQQSALYSYYYETHHGEGKINQFEFTLEEMERPEYWSEKERPQLSFGIYPNPTDNVLFVETQQYIASLSQSTTYRITNVTGQTVLTGSLTVENQRIDVSDLPKGMYFITIGDATRKFVVH
jgi:hypothetical protein